MITSDICQKYTLTAHKIAWSGRPVGPPKPSSDPDPLDQFEVLNTGLRSFRLRPLMCEIWTFR